MSKKIVIFALLATGGLFLLTTQHMNCTIGDGIKSSMVVESKNVSGYKAIVYRLKSPQQPSVWRCGYYAYVTFKDVLAPGNLGLLTAHYIRPRVERLIKGMKFLNDYGDRERLEEADLATLITLPKLGAKILAGEKLQGGDKKTWNRTKNPEVEDPVTIEYKTDLQKKAFVAVVNFAVEDWQGRKAGEFLSEQDTKKVFEDFMRGKQGHLLVLLRHKNDASDHFINVSLERHKDVVHMFYVDSLGGGIERYRSLFERIAQGVAPKGNVADKDYLGEEAVEEEEFPEEELEEEEFPEED